MQDANPLLDELDRKSLDWAEQLACRYAAGLIDKPAYRLAVETMWACMGGAVDTETFKLVIAESNAELATLPDRPQVAIVTGKAGKTIGLERLGEKLTILDIEVMSARTVEFLTEDLAAAKMKEVIDR